MKTYDEAIEKLALRDYHIYMSGDIVYGQTEAARLVAWIYNIDPAAVDQLIKADMDRMIEAQKKVKKESNRHSPAYYDQEGGSMCNGLGREFF